MLCVDEALGVAALEIVMAQGLGIPKAVEGVLLDSVVEGLSWLT